MKYKNNFLIAFCFILFGILSLLNYFHYFKISAEESIGIVFFYYGITSFYKSFGNNQRGTLSFAVIIFLTGIVLIMKSRFELLDTRGIVFTSILFIGGATFIILFLDNTKEKVFLYTGLFLVVLSIVTATYLKDLGIFSFANSMGNYFEYFWPLILIFLGISLFHNRKN